MSTPLDDIDTPLATCAITEIERLQRENAELLKIVGGADTFAKYQEHKKAGRPWSAAMCTDWGRLQYALEEKERENAELRDLITKRYQMRDDEVAALEAKLARLREAIAAAMEAAK